uniref:Zinc finger, C2H2 type n=1 Tax=Panagrellus redivivus TaxID=6233 RepID=A0A7E4W5L8_PANRE
MELPAASGLQRANRPLQLPTVCVSGIGPTTSSASIGNNVVSPLTSPVFIETIQQAVTASTPTAAQIHAFRLASGGATSAMLHERWFSGYRHERTSSSSSDSGVIFQFSPPASATTLGPCPSSASLSISPPGLSPLQLDSAFSTPTPNSGNRFRNHFTFDHVVQSPVHRNNPDGTPMYDISTALAAAAATLKQQQQQTSAAVFSEIMKRATSSGVGSTSSPSATSDLDELKRKQEELIAAGLFSPPAPSVVKSPIFRSESLPTNRFSMQSDVEKMMQSLYAANQFQPRSPVSRTTSLNVGGPPHPAPQQIAFPPPSPLRPFGSLQSAFRTPSVLAKPPVIQMTAPSPPQRIRRKTKSTSGGTDPTFPASGSLPDDPDDPKKQYFCTTCNKDFRRPDILSRHLRRHTGEKPFGCDACGRYFSRSDHLRTHRRTHTDEKPYKCTVCPYAARRRDVLTRHMSTRHQQKAEQTIFSRTRRCISESTAKEQQDIADTDDPEGKSSSPKRQRHTTEIPRIGANGCFDEEDLSDAEDVDIDDDDDLVNEADKFIDVLGIEDSETTEPKPTATIAEPDAS